MNKRGMIERALNKYDAFYGQGTSDENSILVDIEALAEQAIVIECEVEHDASGLDEVPFTLIRAKQSRGGEKQYWLSGHHGTPGKAIAIILGVGEKG